MRFSTVNSHDNSRDQNNSITSNSDNVIGNSNLPPIKVQTKIPFNTLITLQKETNTESSLGINDEIMYKSNIIEQISSHHNPEELFDHTCYENGIIYIIQKKKRMSQ